MTDVLVLNYINLQYKSLFNNLMFHVWTEQQTIETDYFNNLLIQNVVKVMFIFFLSDIYMAVCHCGTF